MFVAANRPRLAVLPFGDARANEYEISLGSSPVLLWIDPATGLLTGVDRSWNLVTLRSPSVLAADRKRLDLRGVTQIVPFGANHLAFYGERRWVLLERESLKRKADEDLVMGSHYHVRLAWEASSSRALTGSAYEKSPLVELNGDFSIKRHISIVRPRAYAMFESASFVDAGRRVAVLWKTHYQRSRDRDTEIGSFLSIYEADDGRVVSARTFDGSALALYPTRDGGFAVVAQAPGDYVKPGSVAYFSRDGTRSALVPIEFDGDLPLVPEPLGNQLLIAGDRGGAAYAFDLEKRRARKLDVGGLKPAGSSIGCALKTDAVSPGGLMVGQMAGGNSMRWSTCLMRSSPDLKVEILAITPVIGDRTVFAFLSETGLLSYDNTTGDLVTWRLPADDEELLRLAEDMSRGPAPSGGAVPAR